MGVCALAGSEAAVDGAGAAQESVEGREGDPGEGMKRSYGLLSIEVGGVGLRPRLESIPTTPMPSPFPWTVFRLNGKRF